MEGSTHTPIGAWLRCYRCWSQKLEAQVHYEGILRIDPVTGERGEPWTRSRRRSCSAWTACTTSRTSRSTTGRIEPVEDRWERMVAGTPVGRLLHGDGRGGAGGGVLGPRGDRLARLRRVRRPRHARVLHPRALPQARRGEDRRSTCSSSSTRARPRRRRGARGGLTRHPFDHLARRGVAPAGVDSASRTTRARNGSPRAGTGQAWAPRLPDLELVDQRRQPPPAERASLGGLTRRVLQTYRGALVPEGAAVLPPARGAPATSS